MSAHPSSDDLLAIPEDAAARIADVSVRRLRDWGEHIIQPSVTRRLGSRTVVRLYHFGDLVELVTVRELLKRGAPIRRVGSLLDYLRGRGHRLQQMEVAVDARQLYWREPDGPWAGGHHPGQTVIPEMLDLEAIRAEVRERARARHGEPGRVVRHRGVRASNPVFAGTRVPVEAVHAYLRTGASDAAILEAYPLLERADIEAARATLDAA